MALGHIISTANIKGGVGKTTTAFLLANEITNRGLTVQILDLDPNRAFMRLKEARENANENPLPWDTQGLKEIGGEDGFFDAVDASREVYDFTILDCEGSQNMLLTYAASIAGLTVIPITPSPLDASALVELMKFINSQSKVMGRKMPYRLLVNQTASGAVKESWEKITIEEIDSNNLPRFQNTLYGGPVFKDIWGKRQTLQEIRADFVKELEALANAKNRQKEEVTKKIAQLDRGIQRSSELCDELFSILAAA